MTNIGSVTDNHFIACHPLNIAFTTQQQYGSEVNNFHLFQIKFTILFN